MQPTGRQVTKNLSSIRAPWVFNFTLSINTIFIFGTRETFVAGDRHRHKAENEREADDGRAMHADANFTVNPIWF